MGKNKSTARMLRRASQERAVLAARRQSADIDLTGYPGPGAKNAYVCMTCTQLTVTVHADHGVTPMFLACRASALCPGQARSTMYAEVPDRYPPAWEWYRPDEREIRKLDGPTAYHVAQGGLLLRAITKESTDGS